MSPRRLAFAALSGTVVLAAALAAGLLSFGSPGIENTYADEGGRAMSDAAAPESADAPQSVAVEQEVVSGGDGAIVDAALPEAPPPETASGQIASSNPSDPVKGETKEVVSPLETVDECLVPQICIDQYLWAAYQRARKIDTIKVPSRIKVTVKKKGKTRTVLKKITKLVDEDFTWKDPKAAQKAGMSLQDYVIGGMDRGFRLKLYRALRAMEDAGLAPGITSGFRDDYRQALASGHKAATDSSYHGGSRRGGYGHGLAADLVSVKGETRAQRWLASESLWKWIDAHEKALGIGRPYLDRDPPHVGPIDGKEYAEKRGIGTAQRTASTATSARRVAVRHDHGKTKRAITASPKVKSI